MDQNPNVPASSQDDSPPESPEPKSVPTTDPHGRKSQPSPATTLILSLVAICVVTGGFCLFWLNFPQQPYRSQAAERTSQEHLIPACKDNQVDKVTTMLRSGINPNVRDHKGFPVLYTAAYYGHVEVVKLLLEAGADANIRTVQGNTPLMAAAPRGDAMIVNLLLAHGAKVELQNQNGDTAMGMATVRGHRDIAALLMPPVSPVSQGVASRDPHSVAAEAKIEVINRMAHNYLATHTYSLSDEFHCVDMSCDLWNQIKTQGIPAGLMAGNIEKNIRQEHWIKYVSEINHAWVLVEVAPKRWVPVESTNGSIILPENKNYSLYFSGEFFINPRELRRFEEVRRNIGKVCQEAMTMRAILPKINEQESYDWALHVAGFADLRTHDCINHLKEIYEALQQNDKRGFPWSTP